MTLRLIGAGGMDPAMTARIEAVEKAAEKAEATGQNAREMVLKRDPRLLSVEGNYEALMALAATVEERTEASEADRAGLHQALEALAMELAAIQLVPGPQGEAGPAGPTGQAGPQGLRGPSGVDGVQGERGPQGVAGPAGKDGARGEQGPTGSAGAQGPQGERGATGPTGATGPQGTPGTPADMTRVTALETAVAALQQLRVTVGHGAANMPASLLAGATTNVTVTLSRDMGSATYSTGVALIGGASLLGSLQVVGVTAQTRSTVTVQVKNTGLAGLLNLSAASVSVVAARDA